MTQTDRSFLFLLLCFLFIAAIFFDLLLGSVEIPIKESLRILAGKSDNTNWSFILIQMRLPRVVNAIITGSGLALAGLLMQTLFRNPLAGPYVLGISSGAGLGVALYVMSLGVFNFIIDTEFYSYGQIIAAILGAVSVFVIVLIIASYIRDSVSLLIVGIMIGSLATAIIGMLQYYSRPELIQKFVIWTLGSLSSASWNHISIMICCVLVSIIISIFLIKPMNAILLGEVSAEATGVNIVRVRYFILLTTSIIVGTLTAYNGPISFIGLIIPHISRLIFSTTNHRILVPACIVNGSILLVGCDLISQVPGRQFVLPINTITALFGAPIVIWIILSKRKTKITL